MFVHYIELLAISSAFIFMFVHVHYIDKVELFISVLLPVKKSRYIEKKNRWNEKKNRQIIEE